MSGEMLYKTGLTYIWLIVIGPKIWNTYMFNIWYIYRSNQNK